MSLIKINQEAINRDNIKKTAKEYQAYLDKTDYKFFNGYKPKEGEDLVAIESKRDEYREFIRVNEYILSGD